MITWWTSEQIESEQVNNTSPPNKIGQLKMNKTWQKKVENRIKNEEINIKREIIGNKF